MRRIRGGELPDFEHQLHAFDGADGRRGILLVRRAQQRIDSRTGVRRLDHRGPSNTSVSPSSGSPPAGGLKKPTQFTFTFSSPNGWQQLWTKMEFNYTFLINAIV